MITYWFDGGGGGEGNGPSGWGWVRSDGAAGCGALAPGTTSNVAEYTALTMAVHDAITVCQHHGDNEFMFRGDSKLVVEQVLGNWRVQSERLRPHVNHVKMLLDGLPWWNIEWIPRKLNSKADEQAWLGKAKWNAAKAKAYDRPLTIHESFKRGWP
jgi:ribonuclease HI